MFSNLKIGFKDRLPFNVAVLIWGSLKKKELLPRAHAVQCVSEQHDRLVRLL